VFTAANVAALVVFFAFVGVTSRGRISLISIRELSPSSATTSEGLT